MANLHTMFQGDTIQKIEEVVASAEANCERERVQEPASEVVARIAHRSKCHELAQEFIRESVEAEEGKPQVQEPTTVERPCVNFENCGNEALVSSPDGLCYPCDQEAELAAASDRFYGSPRV